MAGPEVSKDINKTEDDPWCYSTPEYLIEGMAHGKEFLAKRRAHEEKLMAEAKARAAELSIPPQPNGH